MPGKPLWKRALGPPYRWLRGKLRRLHPRRVAAFGVWIAGIVRAVAARRREPRLTVAVDVAAYWEPLTGVGWYLDRVLRHLAHRDDLRLRLYGEDLIHVDGAPRPVASLPRGPAIEVVRHAVPEDMLLPPGLAARVLHRLKPILIAADRNRVLFAPNFYPPRRYQPAIEIGDARLVVTIHDLAFHHHAWTVDEGTLGLLSRHLDRVLRHAVEIVTPSEAVRRELARAGLASMDRSRAIHHGPGQLAAVESPRPPSWAPERYGLFVGTLEPRKNVETLLEAWRLLRRTRRDAPDLVLCGRLGWKGERLIRQLDGGRKEGWLHQPGYVANEELAALYRRAALVAFPSHYEGFGLPVLEALAVGTPVVASDIPVLREVAGEAVLYAPPARPDLWAARIARLLDDPELARGLAERGRERAGRFTWERSALEHLEVFREAAGVPRTGASKLEEGPHPGPLSVRERGPVGKGVSEGSGGSEG